MKNIKDASYKEWKELEYICKLKSRSGGGETTDMIERIYNTFVSDKAKICRTCPTQLSSVVSILKLRYNLNKDYMEKRFSGPRCKGCDEPFDKEHHFQKYCLNCKPENKYKK